MTGVREDLPELHARQAFLRAAIDQSWTVLWQTGGLGVSNDRDDLDQIIDRMEQYLRKQRNLLVDRQEFTPAISSRMRAWTSTWRLWCRSTTLVHLCGHTCGHGAHIRDTRLRDRLVCGLRDKEMQRRVFMENYEEQLTLTRTLQVCKAFESSRNTEKLLTTESSRVCQVSRRKSTYQRTKPQQLNGSGNSGPDTWPYCGMGQQPRDRCRAAGRSCRKCGKVGHFAAVCRQEKTPQPMTKKGDSEQTLGQLYATESHGTRTAW